MKKLFVYSYDDQGSTNENYAEIDATVVAISDYRSQRIREVGDVVYLFISYDTAFKVSEEILDESDIEPALAALNKL